MRNRSGSSNSVPSPRLFQTKRSLFEPSVGRVSRGDPRLRRPRPSSNMIRDVKSEPSADYALGGTETELNRLRSQAQEYEASARWLLDQIGVRAGWKVLDVGCGPIGILALLSERVAPEGAVVGLEREPRFVELAKREVARLDLRNVTIVQANALHSRLDSDSFDLVHERL